MLPCMTNLESNNAILKQTADATHSLLTSEQNARMFNRVSHHYDRLNRILSLGLDCSWRRRAIALLTPVSAGHYLDIGCGTGDLALEMLRQADDTTVIGIDPAAGMLDYARAKCEEAGIVEHMTFTVGNACALSYPQHTFDGVMSAFCIRNIANRPAAFAEMVRVTRPNGRIMALELTRPQNPLLKFAHRVHSATLIPLASRLVSQSRAYRYLNKSVAQFPSPASLAAEMRAAGMVNIETHPLTGGIVTVFVATRWQKVAGQNVGLH